MASIKLTGDTSGEITIAAPAVAGTNTLTLPADTGTVITSNSPASDLPSTIAGPAFRAYQSTGQAVLNTTFTKIAFDTIAFDTASCYDTVNYSFTPNVAGYYLITGMVRYTGTVDGKVLVARIYKNGVSDTSFEGSSSSSQASTQTTALLYLNGSTDRVEFFSYHNYGATTNTGVFGTGTCTFQGYLVRAA